MELNKMYGTLVKAIEEHREEEEDFDVLLHPDDFERLQNEVSQTEIGSVEIRADGNVEEGMINFVSNTDPEYASEPSRDEVWDGIDVNQNNVGAACSAEFEVIEDVFIGREGSETELEHDAMIVDHKVRRDSPDAARRGIVNSIMSNIESVRRVAMVDETGKTIGVRKTTLGGVKLH